jgi:membrane carboxypeptidase/penicillin-binding protein PbpC
MNKPYNVPPARIPVLTEVIDTGQEDDAATTGPMLDEALAPTDAAIVDTKGAYRHASIDEEALVKRVLEGLHRQIDATIERRVQAALEPIWRRLTEDLSDEVSTALAMALNETLRDAVRDELHQGAGPSAPPA